MRRIMIVAASWLALIAAQPARADIVVDWASFADHLSTGTDRSAESYPCDSQMAVAMFEAANAVDHRYQSFLGLAPAKGPISQSAAVIAAAHAVLVAHYAAKQKMIDDNYAVAIEAFLETPARTAGVALGEEAARLALLRGGVDKAITQVPYRPRTTPGVWIGATLPVFEPYMQALRPWVLASVDAVRPPAPPVLTSDRYARDYDEVRRLGAKIGSERTPHQTLMASYRITPDLMPMLRRISDMPGRSLVQNARMLARLYVAEADEGLAMVDAKMHYQFWRPITAIRNAADDGNPATAPDPAWVPLINTPNHPEYPCGHCGYAAMVATILKDEVGNTPPGGVEVASNSMPDALVQRLPSFDEWVRQVSFSRTLGGVHFRFSDEAGEALGRAVAAKVLPLMAPLRGRN